MNFGELGIADKLVAFSDGKKVTDYFSSLLEEVVVE